MRITLTGEEAIGWSGPDPKGSKRLDSCRPPGAGALGRRVPRLTRNPSTNQAASVPDFGYHQTMTIGITGPERKAPRQSAVVGFIIAAFVTGIGLILLGLASDFLVDWLWFSSIGYLQVFLIGIGAKAVVFFAVLMATAVILWLHV